MKRGAYEHSKMKFLGALCGGIVLARGIVASLWYLAGCETPRGDIGSLSNRRIAAGMGYTGDADELVGWLVESGWLDISPEHRLVIHDWYDHCEEWVRDKVRHSGGSFVGHEDSQTVPSNAETRRAKPKKPEDDRGKPPALSLKPLPSSSSPPRAGEAVTLIDQKPSGDAALEAARRTRADPTIAHVCACMAKAKGIPALMESSNDPRNVAVAVEAMRSRPSPTIHGKEVHIDEMIRRAADLFAAKGTGGPVTGACAWMAEVIENACQSGVWPGERKASNNVMKTVEPEREPVKFKVPDGYKGPM